MFSYDLHVFSYDLHMFSCDLHMFSYDLHIENNGEVRTSQAVKLHDNDHRARFEAETHTIWGLSWGDPPANVAPTVESMVGKDNWRRQQSAPRAAAAT